MNYTEGKLHCLKENLLTVLHCLQRSSQFGFMVSHGRTRGMCTSNAPNMMVPKQKHHMPYSRPFAEKFSTETVSLHSLLEQCLNDIGELSVFAARSLFVQKDGTFHCKGMYTDALPNPSGLDVTYVDHPAQVTGNILLGFELPRITPEKYLPF